MKVQSYTSVMLAKVKSSVASNVAVLLLTSLVLEEEEVSILYFLLTRNAQFTWGGLSSYGKRDSTVGL